MSNHQTPPPMLRPTLPRWSAAVERARELLRRCRAAQCQPADQPADQVADQVALSGTVEGWALVVYAVAVTERCGVSTVSPAQLRFRVEDQTRLTVWLWDVLRRAGHSVPRPTPPRHTRGSATDFEAAVALAGTARSVRHASADDPVVACWTLATVLTAGTSEMSDGTMVDDPVTCTLWTTRASMVRDLDALLVQQRAGWRTGTPVRLYGLPPAITPIGRLATEAGLIPDRALIQAPAWQFDETNAMVGDGPPTAYYVRYLKAATQAPSHDVIGPVPTRNLTTNLTTNLTASPTSTVPDRADRADHTAATNTDTADISKTAAFDTAAATTATATDVPDLTGADMSSGLDDLAEELRRFEPPAWRTTGLPASMAACDEPLRAAAIARLWELRDTELHLAGDSTPRRVAERIADHSFPAPPDPVRSRTLIERERRTPTRRDPRRDPRRDLEGPRSTGPVSQQLVTGPPREVLRDWLDTMSWTTARQCHVLDKLDHPLSLARVRDFLVQEGFTEVLDVHNNADTTADSTDGSTGDLGDRADERDVDLLAVNAGMGWFAVLHVWRDTRGELRPQTLAIYHNTSAVDEDLLATVGHGNWHVDEDDEDGRTSILHGAVRAYLPSHDPRHGSLRVRLATLRAFGTPVTPWVANPSVHVGSDSTPPAEQQRTLTRLPHDVHTLFGPLLTRPAGSAALNSTIVS